MKYKRRITNQTWIKLANDWRKVYSKNHTPLPIEMRWWYRLTGNIVSFYLGLIIGVIFFIYLINWLWV